MAYLRTAAASAAAIGVLLSGSAAFADVTAEQVWNDWKSYMGGFGYQVQAGESMSGNTLTISDMVMTMPLPEVEGTMSLAMDGFEFTDNGDGTVSMMIPPEMPLMMTVTPGEGKGEAVDAKISYNTSGYSVVISGEPADMTYNYTVAQMTIALTELVVDGTPTEFGAASVSVADLTGSSNMKVDGQRVARQRLNAGATAFELDFTDPEGSGQVQMKGAYDSVDFTGGAVIPALDQVDPENLSAMLKAGFGFDGAFGFGPGRTDFTFTDEGEMVQGVSSSGGGSLDVVMNADQLSYAGEASQYRIEVVGGEVPFPVELAMETFGFNLLMPVSSGEVSQDFAFGVTLGGFTMSDLLWSLFDPTSQLPRDPATIALDLTGKVKLLVDLMDPAAMTAFDTGDMAPGELNELDLNNLTISLAGAELTGSGGFTFDNSDMTTFDGMPAPTGAIDLQLVGGNGLLDKLVGMGLVPEDQAMGARMMMGLFAVPGDGEDTLTSKIEVTGDGQVMANGQRIK